MAQVDSWNTRTYIDRAAELDLRHCTIVVFVWPPHSRDIVIPIGDFVPDSGQVHIPKSAENVKVNKI